MKSNYLLSENQFDDLGPNGLPQTFALLSSWMIVGSEQLLNQRHCLMFVNINHIWLILSVNSLTFLSLCRIMIRIQLKLHNLIYLTRSFQSFLFAKESRGGVKCHHIRCRRHSSSHCFAGCDVCHTGRVQNDSHWLATTMDCENYFSTEFVHDNFHITADDHWCFKGTK